MGNGCVGICLAKLLATLSEANLFEALIMQTAQVIALLLPDTAVEMWTGPHSFSKGATALMRDAEGRMTLEAVTSDAAFMEQVMTTGCFKRGKAIVDPISRQIVGYEMEAVAHPSFSGLGIPAVV
jgi:hypothetical protein